jgi:hypothetical protein
MTNDGAMTKVILSTEKLTFLKGRPWGGGGARGLVQVKIRGLGALPTGGESVHQWGCGRAVAYLGGSGDRPLGAEKFFFAFRVVAKRPVKRERNNHNPRPPPCLA